MASRTYTEMCTHVEHVCRRGNAVCSLGPSALATLHERERPSRLQSPVSEIAAWLGDVCDPTENLKKLQLNPRAGFRTVRGNTIMAGTVAEYKV